MHLTFHHALCEGRQGRGGRRRRWIRAAVAVGGRFVRQQNVVGMGLVHASGTGGSTGSPHRPLSSAMYPSWLSQQLDKVRPHLRRAWLTPATSAPGLGSPLPHLRRGWAQCIAPCPCDALAMHRVHIGTLLCQVVAGRPRIHCYACGSSMYRHRAGYATAGGLWAQAAVALCTGHARRLRVSASVLLLRTSDALRCVANGLRVRVRVRVRVRARVCRADRSAPTAAEPDGSGWVVLVDCSGSTVAAERLGSATSHVRVREAGSARPIHRRAHPSAPSP